MNLKTRNSKIKKWEAIFSKKDRILAEKAGFGKRQQYGNKPALIIVDVVKAFLGSKPQAAIDSVNEYRTNCGFAGWTALKHIKNLLYICREKNIPVIFTTIDLAKTKLYGGPDKIWKPDEKWDKSSFEIIPEIKPLNSEFVIKKTKASGFFATPLAKILNNLNIDSLFVIGTSTSGCVRATVVEGLSHNYKIFVVEECTFDRFELSHLVSLWDMNAKYADVISLKEAQNYFINNSILYPKIDTLHLEPYSD